MIRQRHFLLVGNGPYLNRGCEAIVRGTVKILEANFGTNFRITLGTIGDPEIVRRQAGAEFDHRITHIPISNPIRRFSPRWWKLRICRATRKLSERQHFVPSGLDEPLATADAVLEIGGDNYSLHFGKYPPYTVVDLDRYIWARRDIPLVLWGASVGPFDAIPPVAEEMHAHLRRMSAITARETVTFDYLRKSGVDTNVHRVADPAFLLEAAPPKADVSSRVPVGSIGFNVSPLLGRVKLGGDTRSWVELATQTVVETVRRTKRHVLLIPHVTVPEASDYVLMRQMLSRLRQLGVGESEVNLLGDDLSAAETKHVISKMAVFAGARTHATIAALSSGVPTVSFAYSIKAIGLTRDLLADERYCIKPEMFGPDSVATAIETALAERLEIGSRLMQSRDHLTSMAFCGGEVLRSLLQ